MKTKFQSLDQQLEIAKKQRDQKIGDAWDKFRREEKRIIERLGPAFEINQRVMVETGTVMAYAFEAFVTHCHHAPGLGFVYKVKSIDRLINTYFMEHHLRPV